ncbi:MAG: YigZ family protein [Pseudopedobacter saltans]|uniref:YigZ family protein n=1 Tax=Pseudopedobacter saltans TaxID=151895 RepID=A0A2W5EYZ3_9SPHI|nr:MAG: YigZ family protein [Pseudopedobacter saltans]
MSTDANFYHTISNPAHTEFKDKGSKFLAYAYPIKNIDDFKNHLSELKKEHPKANHYCFAYRLGTDGNNFRASDAGEPSGTAGKPILGQIDSKGLTDVLVLVVRYFGGTLLGVPGLINAYKTSTSLVLQLTPIVRKPLTLKIQLDFDYTKMNEVMQWVKKIDGNILKQDMQLFCQFIVEIEKAKRQEAEILLTDIRDIEVKWI